MNHTIVLSDSLYIWLQSEAEKRGLSGIEALLEVWKAEDPELQRRGEVVQRIKALHQKLYEKYGQMSDSTELIREDRDR